MAKDNKKKEPEKPKGEEEGEKEEKKDKEEKEDREEGAEEPKETTPTRRLKRPFQIVSCQSLSKKVWSNSHSFMPDTPKKSNGSQIYWCQFFEPKIMSLK